MKYRLDSGVWSSVFAVPTQIIDKHLKLCGAAQLKVLLLLLRHPEGMELSALASAVNLTQGDTQDAMNYWLECGVLAPDAQQKEAVTLVPQKQASVPEQRTAPSASTGRTEEFAMAAAQVQATSCPVNQAAAPSAGVRPARASTSPPQRPKPPEIEQMIRTDPQLKALLAEAEATLGKPLTSADISTLASLYDWAGMSADVLLLVIGYCASKEKRNLRYIEQVAVSWQENGIDTAEKADSYMRELHETDAQANLVKDAFGLYGRTLTSKESAFVRQWFSEYGFGISLIRLAYERTVDRTGKVSFPYISKILASWHAKGVKTPEDAARVDGEFARGQMQAQAGQKSSYDIDEIEARLFGGSPKPD